MRALFIIVFSFLLMACEADKLVINGENQKEYENSLYAMQRELPSSEQSKLIEAIRIIQHYEVKMDDPELAHSRLMHLINGKDAQEIFAMAERIAYRNHLDWSRESLGNLTDFPDKSEKSKDDNSQQATHSKDYSKFETIKQVRIKYVYKPNEEQAEGLMIFPQLLDANQQVITFKDLPLQYEVVLAQNQTELAAKNITGSDPNLSNPNSKKGILIPFSAINSDKVSGTNASITLRVKSPTTMLSAQNDQIDFSPYLHYLEQKQQQGIVLEENKEAALNTSVLFLENIGNQKLKQAYDLSANPKWKNYDQFASPNFGFGAITKLSINTIEISDFEPQKEKATVKAQYAIEDSVRGNMEINQLLYLQKINDNWKIVNTKKL